MATSATGSLLARLRTQAGVLAARSDVIRPQNTQMIVVLYMDEL